MTNPTIYRGKHPDRLESIISFKPSSPEGRGYRYGFRTNAGAVYGFVPEPGAPPPRLYQEADSVPGATFLYQSEFRRAPQRREPAAVQVAAPIECKGWRLVDERSGAPILKGETRPRHNGGTVQVDDGDPPSRPGTSGYIYTADDARFYPGVVGAKWERVAA